MTTYVLPMPALVPNAAYAVTMTIDPDDPRGTVTDPETGDVFYDGPLIVTEDSPPPALGTTRHGLTVEPDQP